MTSNTTGTSNIFGSGIFGKTAEAAPAPTFSLGGNKDGLFKTATTTTTTTSNTPAANAFSLGGNKDSLFKLPTTSSSTNTTTTTPAAAAAAAPVFSLFGGNKDGPFKTATTSSASTTPAPITAATIVPTFSLGGNKDSLFKPPTTISTNTTPVATAAPIFSLGGNKDAPGPATANTTTTPSTAAGPVVAIPPPSMLRGKTLEEIVNRWTNELETNVREFNRFAAEVAVWDRALIENGNNISALHSHVMAAERQQKDINESLDHIEQQQRDLASTLDTYEKVSQEILGGQGGSLRSLDTGPADNERDKNYMLATDLHTHLDDLSGSLTQMIESVNALSISSNQSESTDDPMTQIAQILSSHLESLQWIDVAVREVESKTVDVEKRVRESGHSLSNSGTKSRGFGLNHYD